MGRSNQEHKWTGVDHTKRTIDLQCLAIAFDFKALTQNNLEYIASLDVLATF